MFLDIALKHDYKKTLFWPSVIFTNVFALLENLKKMVFYFFWNSFFMGVYIF